MTTGTVTDSFTITLLAGGMAIHEMQFEGLTWWILLLFFCAGTYFAEGCYRLVIWRKTSRPTCFGSQPTDQTAAENGCHDCPSESICR